MSGVDGFLRRTAPVTLSLVAAAACAFAVFGVPVADVIGPVVAYFVVLAGVAAWIGRGEHRTYRALGPEADSPTLPPPAQLPPLPLFVGRKDALDSAVAALREARGPTRGARIVLVTGQPGIGKTAFAIRLAHEIAPDHPDGSLYARADDQTADQPSAYAASFASALARVHGGTPDDSAPLRTRTQGRRVLFVLDDVTDASELDALRDLGTGCTVIVTSRSLTNLTEATLAIALGPFTVHDAVDLLTLQLGEGGVERVADSHGAADEIVKAAGLYPLAVRMAAVGLANAPYWSLTSALERLHQLQREEGSAPLDGLDVGYGLLADDERRAVDVIGALDSGRVLAPWMLAALLSAVGASGQDELVARILDSLVRARFLEQFSTDTAGVPLFRVHDQIMIYARRRAERLGEPHLAACRRALAEARSSRSDLGLEHRVIESGLEAMSSGEFDKALRLARDGVSLGRENRDPAVEAAGLVALAEIHAELGATRQAEELIGAAHSVLGGSLSAHALRCTGKIERRLRRLAHAELVLRQAVRSALDTRDLDQAAHAERELAVVLAESGRTGEGFDAARRATRIARSLGQEGAGLLPGALWAQARALIRAGQCAPALERLSEAGSIARGNTSPLWQAWIAYETGRAHLANGDALAGAAAAARASRLFTGMRHEYGAAYCEVLLGECVLADGNQAADAARALESALNTFQRCGDPWIEAETARLLASVRARQGRRPEAAWLYGQSIQAFEQLGDGARATAVRRQRSAIRPGWRRVGLLASSRRRFERQAVAER
jgi:tetratricopeptide (TPR) repeat protein